MSYSNSKFDKKKLKKTTINPKLNNESRSIKKHNLLLTILFIAVTTWLIFSPSLKNSFTNWDDPAYVYENEYIKNLSLENIKNIFSNIIVYNYHPLTIISLAIDYRFSKKIPDDFFGISAYTFHFTNVLIHVFNTILVFILFYLISRKRIEIAIIVALLFGVHPMHVESVSWISERKDVLYSFFFMLGLITWYQYNYKNSKSILLYILTFIFFCLSILSKPAAAIYGLVLLLFNYLQNRKLTWRVILEKIPYFIVGIIIIYITYKAQSKESIGDWKILTIPQRIMFASYGFLAYMIKFIIPIKLSAFYPYPSTFPIKETLHWTFYASPFIVIAIFILLGYFYKRNYKLPVFCILFYFVTILLVIQFVSVGKALMADRYSYIPYIGLSFLIAEGFSYLWRRLKIVLTIKYLIGFILFIYISILSYLTYQRTQIWKNNYTLWTDVIEKFPRKVDVAYKNRGNYFARETKEYDKALKDYNIFLEISPNDPTIYSNRGNLFGLQEKYELSIADYTKAIVLDSNYLDPWVNRGITYMKMNLPEKAIFDFNYAIKLKPDNINNYRYRGYSYLNLNKPDSAINDYNYVISKNASNVNDFFYRGVAYFQLKNYEKAIEDNTNVIKINPQNGSAYYNRSLCYKAMGEYKKAYEDALKAKKFNQNISDAYLKELQILSTKAK